MKGGGRANWKRGRPTDHRGACGALLHRCFATRPVTGRRAAGTREASQATFPASSLSAARLLSSLLSNKWKRRLSVIDSFDNPHISLPSI